MLFRSTPPLVFVDLDHCYDKATNTITDPQAATIVQSLNSYTEASPGSGLHILAYGRLPGNNIHTAIEMYGQNRFTTITTRHIEDTPTMIENRQEAIAALYQRFAPPEQATVRQNTGGVRRRGVCLSCRRKQKMMRSYTNYCKVSLSMAIHQLMSMWHS